MTKVIHPKYSKHWSYAVAHTMDCVCSKMFNHGLNHGLFLSLFKLISCPIHWIVCVCLFKFHIQFLKQFHYGLVCPDTERFKFHLNCLEHSICISLVMTSDRVEGGVSVALDRLSTFSFHLHRRLTGITP